MSVAVWAFLKAESTIAFDCQYQCRSLAGVAHKHVSYLTLLYCRRPNIKLFWFIRKCYTTILDDIFLAVNPSSLINLTVARTITPNWMISRNTATCLRQRESLLASSSLCCVSLLYADIVYERPIIQTTDKADRRGVFVRCYIVIDIRADL
jgi:hypothetical protein